MSDLKKGDTVRAKTFGGGEVTRRVWKDLGRTVFLCSERQFEALMHGWDAPMPIGFPKTDVELVTDGES